MLHRRTPVLTLATALSAVLLLAACGDDDPAGPNAEPGSFQATVSGELSASMTGTALFYETAFGGTSNWVLSLDQDGPEVDGSEVTIARIGTRPATGTYALNGDLADPSGAFYASVSFISPQGIEGTLNNTGGTLEVTRSSAARVEGTFQIEVEGLVVENGEATRVTATVSGSFDAPES